MSDFEKIMDFVLELDKQKSIIRQTYLADGSRKEGDAEHAWHMAIMAILLADYSNEEIDLLKTIKMILLHDVIEIDAGDTYAYDTIANMDKSEREHKAADRIYGILPKHLQKEYRSLWEEFEAETTPEAKFANTLDKVQPVMLNSASDGRAWREHQVRKTQIMKRQAKTHEGSETLWEYAKALIDNNVEKGNIIAE